jgi:hypothetical protein
MGWIEKNWNVREAFLIGCMKVRDCCRVIQSLATDTINMSYAIAFIAVFIVGYILAEDVRITIFSLIILAIVFLSENIPRRK